ncbi:MAG: PKD domain-containing protein [Paludibacter sp.]|nr:PKD domain-containing protein [Paludibacter sp.]
MKKSFGIILLILLSIGINISKAENNNIYKTEFYTFENINSANVNLPDSIGTASEVSASKSGINVTIACVGTSVTFVNSALPTNGQNCSNVANYTWNFGDGTIISVPHQTSPQTLSHTYTVPGSYTVALTTQNGCGTVTTYQDVCIEGPISPSFTTDLNEGCAPLTIKTTNTTNTVGICSVLKYSWSVVYDPGSCGTVSNFSYINSTDSSSVAPVFLFTNPGIYTINLSMSRACGTSSVSQVITVKKPPVVSINPIADVCGTTSISPTASVTTCSTSAASMTYSWSFPGGTPSSSTSLNPGNISYSAPGTYSMSLYATNECGISATSTISFNIKTVPHITNSPLAESVCSGFPTNQINFTSDEPGTTYSWSAVADPGLSGFVPSGNVSYLPSQTITNSNSTPGNVTYTIIPFNGGCSGPAVNYVITVKPEPTITTQPSSATYCVGATPADLSVAISATTDTPIYQWYSFTGVNPGLPISGATNSTFTPPTSSIGSTSYYCIISFLSGTCGNLTSNTVIITVNPLPVINLQPKPTQDICVGGTIGVPLSVGYTGGAGIATYQWYSNIVNNNTTGTIISGAIDSTFTPQPFVTPGTYYYYATVTLSGNSCGSATSNVADINAYAQPTVTSPSILTQSLCQSSTAIPISLTASGGSGTFSYQWYQNPANNNITGTAIIGATNNSYTPLTDNIGKAYYYCVITQTGLNCGVTSSTSEVIVIAQPSVLAQPASSSVCLGGTPATLTVSYQDGVGTPTYQWYSNTVNDNTSGTIIAAANSVSYDPPATALGTLYYYCMITFPASTGCSILTSNTATVTVNSVPVINPQPTLLQEVCLGNTIGAPLTVSYTGGAGLPSYQWYSNTTNSYAGASLIPGAISSTYTPPLYSSPGNYYYFVDLNLSGSNCGPVYSNFAEVIVDPSSVISPQSVPTQTVCINSVPQTLSITASGGLGTYSYQWFINNSNNTTTGSQIAGEISNTYIPSTTSVGTEYYYCVVTSTTGAMCTVTSAAAEVIVKPEPTISSQPTPLLSACIGDTPSLSVSYINGAGTPSYQWYSNTINDTGSGTAIPFATNSVFNPPTTTAGTLYYYCTINLAPGGCSVLVSDAAEVIVKPVPVITGFNTEICNGSTFSVTPVDGTDGIVPAGTTYTWSMPVISPAGSVTGASAQASSQTSISQTLTNTTSTAATVVYTVTPVSGSGCAGNVFGVIVTVDPTINPNVAVKNISCFGSVDGILQANVTGGVPPYSILWTGPSGFTSTDSIITNLYAGNYNLTVTDSRGCNVSNSYTIVEPAEIRITTDVHKNVTFFGADNAYIGITITGGTQPYHYNWTKNGLPFSTSEDLNNIGPGSYEVVVSDTNNCGPKVAYYNVTVPAELIVSLVSKTNIYCNGYSNGAISVDVVGGTPFEISPGVFDYAYSWIGPNGFSSTSKDLTNLVAGMYLLTVTDNSGFSKLLIVTLTEPSKINIDVTSVPKLDCTTGGISETSTAVVTGGTPPYTISWSTGTVSGLNNEIMNTNQSGNVTVQVTDSIGCSNTTNFNLTMPTLGIDFKVLDCDSHLYNFNALIPDSLTAYTYLWDFGDGVTDTNKTVNHTFANPGNYNVRLTITSSTCPTSFVRQITVEGPPVLTLDKEPKICFGDSMIIHVFGANTYKWNNNLTGDSIMINRTGAYTVTGTSAAGCTSTLTFNVSNYDAYNYTIQSNKNEISTGNPTISLWSETIPNSQYYWDFGDGDAGQGNYLDHTYTVANQRYFDIKLKVINPNGCLEYATKRITVINSALYNTFSPNGDGIDDVFMKGWQMKVYNRNGLLIYDGVDGWDGTFNGKPIDAGTYFYVLYYSSESGTKTNSGYVTLVR